MSTIDWGSEGVITTGNQTAPVVAALSTGGWVVVWESGSPGSLVGNGQVFNAAGDPVGSQFTIPSQGGQTEDIQVTGDGGGNFYAGWIDSSISQPYTLEYNGDGVAVGSATEQDISNHSPTTIAMATGPDGTLVGRPYLFYADNAQEIAYSGIGIGAGDAVYGGSDSLTNVGGGVGAADAAFVTTDPGTGDIEYSYALGAFANVNTTINNGHFGSDAFTVTNSDDGHIAELSNGDTVVAFQGEVNGQAGQNIIAAAYDDAGNILAFIDVTSSETSSADTVPISPDTGSQVTPSVTTLSNDEFFVTWASRSQIIGQVLQLGYTYISNANIPVLALFDVGSSFVINGTARAASAPSIAELADGRIVVTYQSTDSSGFGIREQILDLRNGVITGVGDNATFYGSFDNSNDVIIATGQADTLNGGGGNNTLVGQGANDTFELWSDGPGTNNINIVNASGSGTNTLDYSQSPGAVSVNLQSGTTSDFYSGTDGFTGINGVIGTAFNDMLVAGSTGATFNGLGGNNTMVGGSSNDAFRLWSDGPGTNNTNYISGGGGDDTLDYSLAPGPVSVNMETGTTSNYYGGTDHFSGIETVIGSAYNDTFTVGPSGGVSLFGEGGNNTFDMSGGTSTINGGAGTNTLNYSFATGAVTANLATGTTSYFTGGADTFSVIADVTGSAYNDTLTAGLGGGVLNGGAGNNTMMGGAGDEVFELWSDGSGTDYNNYINGGGGLNFLDYTQSPGPVSVNMATGTTSNYYGGTDYFSNILGVLGSAYNDTLTAGSASAFFNGEGGNNTMMGGAGNDTFQLWSDGPGTSNSNYISGGGGANTLDYSQSPGPVNVNVETGQTSNYYGGTDFFSNIQDVIGSAFNDVLIANGAGTVLTGGGGNDTFEFVEGHANGATATDFTSGTDKLLFSGFGTSGATFVQDNSTTWTVNSANGIDHENIAFANTPTIHPSDYSFV